MFIDRILSPAVFVCSPAFISLAFPFNAWRPMRNGDNSSAHRTPLENRLRVFNYFKTALNPEIASEHNKYTYLYLYHKFITQLDRESRSVKFIVRTL